MPMVMGGQKKMKMTIGGGASSGKVAVSSSDPLQRAAAAMRAKAIQKKYASLILLVQTPQCWIHHLSLFYEATRVLTARYFPFYIYVTDHTASCMVVNQSVSYLLHFKSPVDCYYVLAGLCVFSIIVFHAVFVSVQIIPLVDSPLEPMRRTLDMGINIRDLTNNLMTGKP